MRKLIKTMVKNLSYNKFYTSRVPQTPTTIFQTVICEPIQYLWDI